MSNEQKKRCKVGAWFAGILFAVSAFFASRKDDDIQGTVNGPRFEDDDGVMPPIENDEPQLDLYLVGQDAPERGDIHHEVKIDTAGRVYFKISGRWRLQSDIEEVHAYRLRTLDKMDDVSRRRATEEDV